MITSNKTAFSALASEKCEDCHANALGVLELELPELLKQLPEWHIQTVDESMQITRIYHFPNFIDALTFTNLVGNLAESTNHHPAILVEWGRVSVTWWTHKIRGLHRNDFILAARTDQLFSTN